MAIARYVVSMVAVAAVVAVAACAAPAVPRSMAGAASAPASPAASAPRSASPALDAVASRVAVGSGASVAAVAWVDRPAPPEVPASPSPLPTDARPCRPADLKVAVGAVGVGLGNTNLPISFTNASASTCVIAGYPALAGVTAAGRIVPQDPQHGSYFGDPGPPANIAPGDTAVVFISGASACQAVPIGRPEQTFPRLRITLPAGGFVDVAGDIGLGCGVWVSAFGVPALQPPSSEPPMSPLVAHMDAPPTARAGQLLQYTVTLTNPTAETYILDPCPAYTEYVSSGAQGPWVATIRDYYLNCDVVREIAAHASVTYEMQLQLPADQPVTTQVKLGWSMHGGAGPYAAEALAVVS
jgi:hypothetical protein